MTGVLTSNVSVLPVRVMVYPSDCDGASCTSGGLQRLKGRSGIAHPDAEDTRARTTVTVNLGVPAKQVRKLRPLDTARAITKKIRHSQLRRELHSPSGTETFRKSQQIKSFILDYPLIYIQHHELHTLSREYSHSTPLSPPRRTGPWRPCVNIYQA